MSPNRTETATARPGGIDQWECMTAGTRVKCVFPPSANQKAGIFRFLPGCTQENANELCSLPSFREKGVFPFPGKKEQDSGYPWISSIKVNPPSPSAYLCGCMLWFFYILFNFYTFSFLPLGSRKKWSWKHVVIHALVTWCGESTSCSVFSINLIAPFTKVPV